MIVPFIELPVTFPVYLRIADGERDLVAMQPGVRDRRWTERAGELLELLRQRQLPLRQRPRALDLRRHDPQERRAPARAVVGDGLGLDPAPSLPS